MFFIPSLFGGYLRCNHTSLSQQEEISIPFSFFIVSVIFRLLSIFSTLFFQISSWTCSCKRITLTRIFNSNLLIIEKKTQRNKQNPAMNVTHLIWTLLVIGWIYSIDEELFANAGQGLRSKPERFHSLKDHMQHRPPGVYCAKDDDIVTANAYLCSLIHDPKLPSPQRETLTRNLMRDARLLRCAVPFLANVSLLPDFVIEIN